MRQGKRFTPAWIRRAFADGRGLGTDANYKPWHQVRRTDPSSEGRSHLIKWKFERPHHLLSDQELAPFAFATMLPNVIDTREQFPLSRDEHEFEVVSYRASQRGSSAPGTRSVAAELGIRHPVVRESGDKEDWVLSTDLLLTLASPTQQPTFLAISVKSHKEAKERRKRELLLIEKTYWEIQGEEWLLFIPSNHSAAILNTVVQALPWATFLPSQPRSRIQACRAIAPALEGLTLNGAFEVLIEHFGISQGEAQQVFWQSVWAGCIPLCLDRFCFQLDPLRLLDPRSFWAQNPVFSRRSSWMA